MTDAGKRLIKNASYLFLGAVLANIASFVFRIIVAREFGADGFGVFSLALMVTSVATTISLLGLPDGMENFVSKFREKQNSSRVMGVILTGGGLSIAFSLILTAILILTSSFIATEIFESPRLADILVWFSLVVPASVVVKMAGSIAMGYERGEYKVTINQVLPRLLSVVFTIIVILVGAPLLAVGKVYVGSMWISAGIGTLIVARMAPMEVATTAEVEPKRLVSFSVPLMFTATIGMFLNWVDTAVVGVYLNEADVGTYQSAFLLGSSLSIFSSAIAGSLYPHFSSLIVQDKFEVIKDRFAEGRRWAVLMMIAPVTYLVVFSGESLAFLFGEEFRVAGMALTVIVIGQFISGVFGSVTNLLKPLGESRFIFISYSVGAVLNALLNVLLVPRIGIVGAGIGTATATILIQGSHFYRVRTHLEVPFRDVRLVPAVGAALVAVIPAIYLSNHVDSVPLFTMHIAMYSIIYVSSLYLFGAFSDEELRKAAALVGF